ncbi:MAG: carboxypeptidase-like regulatory domain-containing protein [Bacteroidetes bacterium]|nr:MAG: carboxypeptidase-like regulatory domain-containing protein [Bacteroidota bacterium]
MKKTILSIVFIALLGFVYADNEGEINGKSVAPSQTISLSGSVMDFESGEALTGVEVKLEGIDIKAYTDFDGNFEFDGVKPGNYNIIASYVSYDKSLVENFKANVENCEVDIKLQSTK